MVANDWSSRRLNRTCLAGALRLVVEGVDRGALAVAQHHHPHVLLATAGHVALEGADAVRPAGGVVAHLQGIQPLAEAEREGEVALVAEVGDDLGGGAR